MKNRDSLENATIFFYCIKNSNAVNNYSEEQLVTINYIIKSVVSYNTGSYMQDLFIIVKPF